MSEGVRIEPTMDVQTCTWGGCRVIETGPGARDRMLDHIGGHIASQALDAAFGHRQDDGREHQ